MRPGSIRKGLGVLVSLAAFASVILLAALTTWRMDLRPRTDDAYLQADLVHMAPEVSGRIVELAVRDNQMVQRTEVLVKGAKFRNFARENLSNKISLLAGA